MWPVTGDTWDDERRPKVISKNKSSESKGNQANDFSELNGNENMSNLTNFVFKI